MAIVAGLNLKFIVNIIDIIILISQHHINFIPRGLFIFFNFFLFLWNRDLTRYNKLPRAKSHDIPDQPFGTDLFNC